MSGVRYHVEHVTRYVHAARVSTSQHIACLTPRTLDQQIVLCHDLTIDPCPSDHAERRDYFGNIVGQFTILTPYAELRVVGASLVEVTARPAPDSESSVPWEEALRMTPPEPRAPGESPDQFRYRSPYVQPAPELADYARGVFTPGRPLLAAAVDLMHRIHEEFQFDPGATTITTPATRVLAERHGVCQDFAHLAIACLRSLGLPARYVSGYLLTDPPPGQPRLIGADASHAWLSVWCPGDGWVDLDPTNAVIPSLRHVTIAWGRDYGDVSPLRGVALGGAEHELYVGVSVVPIGVVPIGLASTPAGGDGPS